MNASIVCTCSFDDGMHEWNCAIEKHKRNYDGIAIDKEVMGYAQLFAKAMQGKIVKIDYYNNRCLLEWKNEEREWVTIWDIQNRNK